MTSTSSDASPAPSRVLCTVPRPREDAARRGGATGVPTVEHFEVAIDTMA